MAGLVSYELQTYRAGQWRIDSVFDDREIALFEARRLEDSGRYSGVRVVQERFDPATGDHSTRTVYRGTRTDQENAEVLERRKEVRREVETIRKSRREPAKGATSRAKKSGVAGAAVGFTLTLGAILLFGIALILLLRAMGGAA